MLDQKVFQYSSYKKFHSDLQLKKFLTNQPELKRAKKEIKGTFN